MQIVGHSLGGMLARGLAVRRPDLVAGHRHDGQPDAGARRAHHVSLTASVELLVRLSRAGVPGLMAEDCVAGDVRPAELRREPRAAARRASRFTAIYSRRDGIVDWRACVDPLAAPVEVTASHLGMAFDPRVIDHVRGGAARAEAPRPQCSKSIAAKARSFCSWCSEVIERIVPLRERITSEWVVQPPAR